MADRPIVERVLRIGMSGHDVRYAQRILQRNVFEKPWYSGSPDGDFGEFTRAAVIAAKYDLGFPPEMVVGSFGTRLERLLRGVDELPADYRRRRDKRAKEVKLIEPKQGFDSLDRSLWEPYSICLRSFLSYDLGTYARKPGDHGVWPSMAFDIGFRPWTGWNHPAARACFWKMAAHPKVEYVILGTKIHFKASGLRPYSLGGHENHLHISGFR